MTEENGPMSRFDDIKARLAAATPGPWVTSNVQPGLDIYEVYIPGQPTRGWLRGNDADLIVNAPTDLAALVAALDAVIDLAENCRISENQEVLDVITKALGCGVE